MSARDIVTVIGLLLLVGTNLRKIYVLQRNTRRWNGLGRAMRLEKIAYVVLFAWLLLREYLPLLDDNLIFGGVVVLIVIAEAHTNRDLPRVWIRHDRPPGGPTV